MCPVPLEMNQFTDEKGFIMKKAFCFFILVFTVCFICEKHPALAVDITPCLTIHPDLIPLANDEGGQERKEPRGVVDKKYIWTPEQTVGHETDSTLILTVRFLEVVASGVYFYTIAVENFSATRKMLIQTISKMAISRIRTYAIMQSHLW